MIVVERALRGECHAFSSSWLILMASWRRRPRLSAARPWSKRVKPAPRIASSRASSAGSSPTGMSSPRSASSRPPAPAAIFRAMPSPASPRGSTPRGAAARLTGQVEENGFRSRQLEQANRPLRTDSPPARRLEPPAPPRDPPPSRPQPEPEPAPRVTRAGAGGAAPAGSNDGAEEAIMPASASGNARRYEGLRPRSKRPRSHPSSRWRAGCAIAGPRLSGRQQAGHRGANSARQLSGQSGREAGRRQPALSRPRADPAQPPPRGLPGPGRARPSIRTCAPPSEASSPPPAAPPRCNLISA